MARSEPQRSADGAGDGFRPVADVPRLLAPLDPTVATKLYEQAWLQARHAETGRQTFLQIYLVVVGVSIGFIGNQRSSPDADQLLAGIGLFLVGVSVFGLLFTSAANVAYTIFSRQAERVQLAQLDPMGAFITFHGSWPRPAKRMQIPILRLYLWAYIVGATVFAAAAGSAVSPATAVVAGLVVFVALGLMAQLNLEPRRLMYVAQFDRDAAAILAARRPPAEAGQERQ